MFEWNDDFVKELQTAKNKYARKLKYTNPYYELENFSMKELRDIIQTKTDYNTVLKYFNQFDPKAQSKPVASHGNIPKYVLNELEFIKKLTDPKNAIRDQEITELIETNTFYKQSVHSNEEVAYKPKVIQTGKTPYEYKKFKMSMRKQMTASYDINRDAQYKYNYLKAFYRIFNGYNVDKLMSLLDKIPDHLFYRFSIQTNLTYIKTIYNPVRDDEEKNHADSIIEAWEKRLGLYGKTKKIIKSNVKRVRRHNNTLNSHYRNEVMPTTRYNDETLEQIIAELYS